MPTLGIPNNPGAPRPLFLNVDFRARRGVGDHGSPQHPSDQGSPCETCVSARGFVHRQAPGAWFIDTPPQPQEVGAVVPTSVLRELRLRKLGDSPGGHRPAHLGSSGLKPQSQGPLRGGASTPSEVALGLGVASGGTKRAQAAPQWRPRATWLTSRPALPATAPPPPGPRPELGLRPALPAAQGYTLLLLVVLPVLPRRLLREQTARCECVWAAGRVWVLASCVTWESHLPLWASRFSGVESS